MNAIDYVTITNTTTTWNVSTTSGITSSISVRPSVYVRTVWGRRLFGIVLTEMIEELRA